MGCTIAGHNSRNTLTIPGYHQDVQTTQSHLTDPSYSANPGTVHGWEYCIPLSEYLKIQKYSDHTHPCTVPGWLEYLGISRCSDKGVQCAHPSTVPRWSEYLGISRHSDKGVQCAHPRPVLGYTAHPCESISRSRDTLTIPGQYMDGHTAPPCQSIS